VHLPSVAARGGDPATGAAPASTGAAPNLQSSPTILRVLSSLAARLPPGRASQLDTLLRHQPAATPGQSGIVNSHNEWDPLEEVIVGRVEGAVIPSNHVIVTSNIPGTTAKLFGLAAGRRYPKFLVEPAQEELEGFIDLLVQLGVTVRRPEVPDNRASFQTPNWKAHGFVNACPRDCLLVIGDEIIETPMAWRDRYFETFSYRPLLKEYFLRGARWTAAPKPQLLDSLYVRNFQPAAHGEPVKYVTTEAEPVFDAADFVRCGEDLFVIRSNVTNELGIAWLQRHLGDRYRIHTIEQRCERPMHIDTTFMPLAPGKLLINPEYLDVNTLPEMFRSWDVRAIPEPDPIRDPRLKLASMCGKWLNMNVLMLDEKRVIVEKHHTTTIRFFEDWGFEPIPCSFLHYAPFGGSFHCATLDIRRRGTLERYF
jgi:glycine amidinotransferase